jgi:hypothetical protein
MPSSIASCRSVLGVILLGWVIAGPHLERAWAQQEPPPPGSGIAAPRPVASAVQITEPPLVDGVLDERVWQQATPLMHFVQAEPFEGQPASEKTEVRILYDHEAIYVGVICHDSDPSQIVTTDTRRDAGLAEMDSFQIIFDTFRDQQNGFVFGTNAAGIQYDAQVRSQGAPTPSWDGSWEVETSNTLTGWAAEFRIPLRTLRYGPPPQTWGVNFFRNIRRTRERTYWAPLARTYNVERLSSAGELRGLNLQSPRNFKILPYLVSSADRNFLARTDTALDSDFGFDVKFGVTPSLNLDVTYNTDFAQVEVDTQQINLTRFNLRFPEKRPFFQENAGLFTVGKDTELDLFFSRRIGLDEDGALVPITGGARLTGKASGFNVGVLNIQTDDAGTDPANNFSVMRVSRELRNRSGLGAMFVNRTATGHLAGADDWNRTWGADARLGVGESVTVAGFAARTETPGLGGRDYAYNVDAEYDDNRHLVNLQYGVTGEDFNPEVGYLAREEGYRRFYFRVQETMRQERIRRWGFREFLPHINYTRYDYLDGLGLHSAELHIDNHWDWENGNYISTALNGTWDGLLVPFEIYPGVIVPPGEHGGLRLLLRANTDRRKWVYGRLQWDVGRFMTGDQNSPTVQVVLRDSGRFTVDTTWSYRAISLPEGRFTTNLGNAGVTYNFTPSVFVQSLIQYNDRTDRWSTNLRFHWLQTAGTGLFVVYNDTEALNGLGPVNRAFIVKYVRQFDILN